MLYHRSEVWTLYHTYGCYTKGMDVYLRSEVLMFYQRYGCYTTDLSFVKQKKFPSCEFSGGFYFRIDLPKYNTHPSMKTNVHIC